MSFSEVEFGLRSKTFVEFMVGVSKKLEASPGGSREAEAGDRNELDDRMPLGLLGNTEVLTSVCNAQFDFREELYDDEQVLCELAIYPPMCNTVPDAPYVADDEA